MTRYWNSLSLFQKHVEVNRYLYTDNSVPRLGAVLRRVVSFLLELLPGPGLALSHRVDGFQVRRVRQHGDVHGVGGSEIQQHRGGEVGEDVADGRRGVGELAEAAHLTEHQLERDSRLRRRVVVQAQGHFEESLSFHTEYAFFHAKGKNRKKNRNTHAEGAVCRLALSALLTSENTCAINKQAIYSCCVCAYVWIMPVW